MQTGPGILEIAHTYASIVREWQSNTIFDECKAEAIESNFNLIKFILVAICISYWQPGL